jgi:small GTP-binding protein
MTDSGSSPIETFKVVLLGEMGVGKTSIIAQFMDQTFQEDLQSSTGGTFSSKTFTYGGGKLLKFEIWDTAGQERYRSLTTMFYKDANAACLVYDITRKLTFEEMQNYWVQQIKENAPKDLILIIVGNKSDLTDEEEVDEDTARKFAEDLNAMFFTTSAKNYSGICDLFIQIAKKYTKADDVQIQNEEDCTNTMKDGDVKKAGSVKLSKKKSEEKHKKRKCC